MTFSRAFCIGFTIRSSIARPRESPVVETPLLNRRQSQPYGDVAVVLAKS